MKSEGESVAAEIVRLLAKNKISLTAVDVVFNRAKLIIELQEVQPPESTEDPG